MDSDVGQTRRSYTLKAVARKHKLVSLVNHYNFNIWKNQTLEPFSTGLAERRAFAQIAADYVEEKIAEGGHNEQQSKNQKGSP